jgi:hypothetical protein
MAAADAKVAQLAEQRTKVAQRYQDQLATVDRLKKARASWNRDRDLRASLADSADTANQLAALNQQLEAARTTAVQARRALLAAIDGELAAGATGARAASLAKWKAQLGPQAGAALKKIVLPDAEIDPLADPEELDQQVQVIAETEKQLANQVAGLDAQATELTHVAELRKHHERANDLMLREDDQPHRNVQASTGGRDHLVDGAPTITSPTTPGTGGDNSGGGVGTQTAFGDPKPAFETEATFVLGEVIDRSAIDGLTRASRSGDPAKRAEAARLARDAVAARLELLKKKRAQIEQRAKQLRGKR